MSAGWPATAGACRWCTPRTPSPRSRTPGVRPTSRSSRRSARRRGPDRRRGRPAGRRDARSRRHELIELYGADPARVSIVAPGVDLDLFRPGRPRRRPGRAGAARRRRRPAVRRADPAAQGARRADPRGRRAAPARPAPGRPARGRGGRRRSAAGATATASCRRSPPSWVWATPCGSCRRSRGTACPTSTGPPTSWSCPSRSESFGLAALEAQACGTPVVATPVGGLPVAVADERSGLLTAGHDRSRSRRAVHRILTDPDLAARLSAGRPAHAASFAWDRTVDGLLAAYRRGAGPPGQRPGGAGEVSAAGPAGDDRPHPGGARCRASRHPRRARAERISAPPRARSW